mmetsp:Transcript_17479/g.52543  ORF Transcript_17479/g.52543 Transcript_17479/m.52543 type:complete len:200 (-) Transcript_17479:710-1309(-)
MKRPRSSSGEAPRWGAEEADGAAASTSGAQAKPMSDELELSLQVKWTSGTGTSQGPGKTRITRLMLKPLEDVDRLGAVPATRKESTPAENGRLKRNSQHSTLHVGHVCLFSDNPDLVSSSVPPAAGGLSKGLMDRAFPAESRPNYLTDDLFYRWTPHETWWVWRMHMHHAVHTMRDVIHPAVTHHANGWCSCAAACLIR